MYLYHRRTPISNRIFTPLLMENQKHGVPDEDLEGYIIDFRAGDYSRLGELLNAYLFLLRHISTQYYVLVKHFQKDVGEDILSVAIISFIDGCHNLEKLQDNGLIGFLISKVHTAISMFMSDLRLVNPPRGSLHHLKKKGIVIQEIECIDPEGFYIDPKQNHVDYIQLEEIVEQSILTRRDRVVMNMKREGHSLQEIAEAINRSVPTVSKVLDAMKERICEKLNS